MFQYDAAWPIYALDWCKQPIPSSTSSRPSVRLAAGSLTDDYRNQIVVLGPSDERILIEDDADGSEELVELAAATHGYPATSLQWQPSSAAGAGWTNKGTQADVLASTGDILRVWSFGAESTGGSGYVGRGAPVQYSLTARHQLSGTKSTNGIYAPLTSFSWNTTNAARIVTASVDTTCTVWDIEAAQAVTQLIAHDRAVYDVAWLPTSTDIFVSVGADGSLRAFDLRSLEHSTILYETPAPKSSSSTTSATSASGSPARAGTSPLLRICFHPTDNNYMATFHLDGQDVQILDMRSPGSPVIELRGHRAQVNAIAFGAGDQPLLATAGDDCQVLLWDLQAYTSGKAPPTSSRHGSSPRPDSTKKRVVNEPVMAYTGPGEMTSLAWAPPRTASGEWLAMATGRTVKVLKV